MEYTNNTSQTSTHHVNTTSLPVDLYNVAWSPDANYNSSNSTNVTRVETFNYSLVVNVTMGLCITACILALLMVLLLVTYARCRDHPKAEPALGLKTEDVDSSGHPSCALLINGYQRRVVVPETAPSDNTQEEPSATRS